MSDNGLEVDDILLHDNNSEAFEVLYRKTTQELIPSFIFRTIVVFILAFCISTLLVFTNLNEGSFINRIFEKFAIFMYPALAEGSTPTALQGFTLLAILSIPIFILLLLISIRQTIQYKKNYMVFANSKGVFVKDRRLNTRLAKRLNPINGYHWKQLSGCYTPNSDGYLIDRGNVLLSFTNPNLAQKILIKKARKPLEITNRIDNLIDHFTHKTQIDILKKSKD